MIDVFGLCFVPGASVHQLNTEGETPLTHAEYANQHEIVKLLQAALEQEREGEMIENDGDSCICLLVLVGSELLAEKDSDSGCTVCVDVCLC